MGGGVSGWLVTGSRFEWGVDPLVFTEASFLFPLAGMVWEKTIGRCADVRLDPSCGWLSVGVGITKFLISLDIGVWSLA